MPCISSHWPWTPSRTLAQRNLEYPSLISWLNVSLPVEWYNAIVSRTLGSRHMRAGQVAWNLSPLVYRNKLFKSLGKPDQTSDRESQLTRKIRHVDLHHFVPQSMKLTVRELKKRRCGPAQPPNFQLLSARAPWAHTEGRAVNLAPDVTSAATGFSLSTCLPVASAFKMMDGCWVIGGMMITDKMSGLARSAGRCPVEILSEVTEKYRTAQ
ncbi:hypothetical protein EV702DRAFT_1271124 [Suillus placidus]|uniref:Uncharacterized protein n=1 Tax=Suillus placidus TaxID=48579 RepID=A0A9P6ZKQ1_9AGAM|nr:hypothetical protein EV702DRAFT_1271124 [Suillus placidus]